MDKLGYVLYAVGVVGLVGYVLTMCIVVVCEIFDLRHPSEDKVTRGAIKGGCVYALIVFIYFIGRLGARVC